MFSAINFDLFKKYLCHESCSETGSVFEVAAGWAAKIQTESAAGAVFAKSKGAGLKKRHSCEFAEIDRRKENKRRVKSENPGK